MRAPASSLTRNRSPFAVTLQPREKTLTDKEIEAISTRIVAEVGKRADGVLRE
jgi:phenylalanyl-tRNA synthetase beta subunit